MEQLIRIVIRYIKEYEPVENVIELTECPVVTGEAVCQKSIDCLQGLTLDPAHCRATTYDGAGDVAGAINVCAANVMKIVAQAHYYHCASHSLNLALYKACKVPEVKNMMSTLLPLAAFFKYSPTTRVIYRRDQNSEEA